MACKACGGTDIEHDTSKGMSYCTACGEVCEENTIVAEVTFGESSSGAAIVQGSFIRAGQTRAAMGGPGRFGSGQESREMTLLTSRRRLIRLATAVGLSEHFVDSAQRYFTLALNLNFTRGRRAAYVSAACLYIVCRMEKTSQMLIDFSDILQASVFKLGAIFAKLVQALNLQVPLVDPSLYISRFAAMLEFGDKTQAVCMDAIRLVQRMDRDWIRTGRRPAGICGACLLVAARMHNFRRTQLEIIRVVKVADATLRRRLAEFRNTPSGDLTVADFRSLWLEQSADPPAFTRSRIKARQHQEQQRSAEGEEAAGILHQLRRGSNAGSEQVQDMGELPDDYDIVVNEAISNELDMYLNDSNLQFINASTVSDSFDPDVSKWTDIDDDEVRNIILNDAEVQMKTEIWDAENKQFVEDRERKRKAREAEKGNKRRRKSVRKRVAEPGATALESTQNLLNMRRLSKKINYDVLKNLLEPDGPKPTVEPTHLSMIPSGAPSRMISVAATPIAGSGYATPTMELEYNSDSLNGLPDALAKVNGDHMDTIVIEQGKEDLAVATGTTAADIEDDDDDEEEDFEDDAGAAVAYEDDTYGDMYSQFNDDDGEY